MFWPFFGIVVFHEAKTNSYSSAVHVSNILKGVFFFSHSEENEKGKLKEFVTYLENNAFWKLKHLSGKHGI